MSKIKYKEVIHLATINSDMLLSCGIAEIFTELV